jgi:hypothetical protein
MRAFPSTRYANVTATLALLPSLGGTATAASITLVTRSQVKAGSLTLGDLASSAIQALYSQSESGGAAPRSLRLAGYANPSPQTLPDDTTFHTICAATVPAIPSTSRSRWRRSRSRCRKLLRPTPPQRMYWRRLPPFAVASFLDNPGADRGPWERLGHSPLAGAAPVDHADAAP